MLMIFFSMHISDKKRKLNTPASDLEDYHAEPLHELKNMRSILQYWRKRESLYHPGQNGKGRAGMSSKYE